MLVTLASLASAVVEMIDDVSFAATSIEAALVVPPVMKASAVPLTMLLASAPPITWALPSNRPVKAEVASLDRLAVIDALSVAVTESAPEASMVESVIEAWSVEGSELPNEVVINALNAWARTSTLLGVQPTVLNASRTS